MSNYKAIVKTATKRSIYEKYDIEYRNGKIYHPVFGWINPLLINGNAKLGKGVWTFSVLAANKLYTFESNGKEYCLINPNCVFWTYTKVEAFENAFDELPNANIVKSLINCNGLSGLNYGHADYIIAMYKALKAMGKKVYICRCGIDKNQHCTNCHSCAENDYVLFIEHGTGYKVEDDPLYDDIKALIEFQSANTKQAAN